MERILEAIFGFIFAILAGIFVGAAVVAVTYVVMERITAANVGRLSREALAKDREAKNLIGQALQLEITKKQGAVLSLKALRNGKHVADIQLKGNSVADDVHVGMKVTA